MVLFGTRVKRIYKVHPHLVRRAEKPATSLAWCGPIEDAEVRVAKSNRGGRRLRRYAIRSDLGEIDPSSIIRLIGEFSPEGTTDQRKDLALRIILKGIESFRENCQTTPNAPGWIQGQRRALAKLMRGKAEARPPFSSMLVFNGFLYGAGSEGLVQILDEPYESIEETGLHSSIANPLRILGMEQQASAGHRNISPNVLLNPPAMDYADDNRRYAADEIIDALAHAREWDVELAAYAYFAITRALSTVAPTSWYDIEPDRVRKGWCYGRLLVAAGLEAGAVLPHSRNGMEKLLKKGRACALEPAITYPDGRSLTALEIEFPEFVPQK